MAVADAARVFQQHVWVRVRGEDAVNWGGRDAVAAADEADGVRAQVRRVGAERRRKVRDAREAEVHVARTGDGWRLGARVQRPPARNV